MHLCPSSLCFIPFPPPKPPPGVCPLHFSKLLPRQVLEPPTFFFLSQLRILRSLSVPFPPHFSPPPPPVSVSLAPFRFYLWLVSSNPNFLPPPLVVACSPACATFTQPPMQLLLPLPPFHFGFASPFPLSFPSPLVSPHPPTQTPDN